MILGAALEQVLSTSQETFKFDVDTKRAELRSRGEMLIGRQIVHKILNFSRTDRSLSTQFVVQGLALI
eukprot:11205195-Lingulodinium_polyedra.AAC.1